jgi:hypothetical protein
MHYLRESTVIKLMAAGFALLLIAMAVSLYSTL